MTLSDRFEQMESKRQVVKPVYNTGPSQRRVDVDSRRKVGRQVQFDARRQGVANPKPAMRVAQSKVVSPRQQPQQQQQRTSGRGRDGRNQKTGGTSLRTNAQKPGASRGTANGRGTGRGAGRTGGRGSNAGTRGGGRGGRGERGAQRGGRGNGKSSTAPPKNTDLDEGLDEYWFKAGKGPDPQVAALDRKLDSYWSSTNKTNGDAAAGDKMEDTEASEAPAVAPVAGVDPDL